MSHGEGRGCKILWREGVGVVGEGEERREGEGKVAGQMLELRAGRRGKWIVVGR